MLLLFFFYLDCQGVFCDICFFFRFFFVAGARIVSNDFGSRLTIQLPLDSFGKQHENVIISMHSMCEYLNYDTKYYLWGGFAFFLHVLLGFFFFLLLLLLLLSIHLTLYQSAPRHRRKRLYFWVCTQIDSDHSSMSLTHEICMLWF